jgi:hypothetical protein
MVGSGEGAPSLFGMKPAALIEALARELVTEQIQIAQLRQKLAALPATAADTHPVEVQALRAKIDAFVEAWVSKQLPNLTAAFRLALEVLDTYGPDGVSIDDEIEAGIWNNKYFVWLREFGGEAPQ